MRVKSSALLCFRPGHHGAAEENGKTQARMQRLLFKETAPVPKIVDKPESCCIASSQEVLLDGSNTALVRDYVFERVLLESRASLRAARSPQQVFYPASAEGRDTTRRKHTCGNARHSQAQGYTFQFRRLGEGATTNVRQITATSAAKAPRNHSHGHHHQRTTTAAATATKDLRAKKKVRQILCGQIVVGDGHLGWHKLEHSRPIANNARAKPQ